MSKRPFLKAFLASFLVYLAPVTMPDSPIFFLGLFFLYPNVWQSASTCMKLFLVPQVLAAILFYWFFRRPSWLRAIPAAMIFTIQFFWFAPQLPSMIAKWLEREGKNTALDIIDPYRGSRNVEFGPSDIEIVTTDGKAVRDAVFMVSLDVEKFGFAKDCYLLSGVHTSFALPFPCWHDSYPGKVYTATSDVSGKIHFLARAEEFRLGRRARSLEWGLLGVRLPGCDRCETSPSVSSWDILSSTEASDDDCSRFTRRERLFPKQIRCALKVSQAELEDMKEKTRIRKKCPESSSDTCSQKR